MDGFGGKGVGQVVAGFGSSGLGKALAAVAAAFLLRLFSGPGSELSPEMEAVDNDIEHQNDADATVNGKVYPVTIRWWRNITCSLSDKSSTSVQFLLKNVGGEAKSGRLLAIMGPSGSGKMTLLNVLAGQVMASPRLHLSGLWEVNGKPSSNKAYNIVFGILFILLCLLYMLFQVCFCETGGLVFLAADCAGELQLPEIATVEARDEYVNNLLFKLGLVNCVDSIVGDAKVRGISGGKKKRLSVACELIASPSVIFADEPTTVLSTGTTNIKYHVSSIEMGQRSMLAKYGKDIFVDSSSSDTIQTLYHLGKLSSRNGSENKFKTTDRKVSDPFFFVVSTLMENLVIQKQRSFSSCSLIKLPKQIGYRPLVPTWFVLYGF
ncbi:hypothetical protein UlMin_026698 [Ulmus minor]